MFNEATFWCGTFWNRTYVTYEVVMHITEMHRFCKIIFQLELSARDANNSVVALGTTCMKAGWLHPRFWCGMLSGTVNTDGLFETVPRMCVVWCSKGFVFSVFSADEMQALYKKSLDFVGTVMHSFRFLYRCKPKIYYDDIQVSKNSFQYMTRFCFTCFFSSRTKRGPGSSLLYRKW